MVIVETTDSLDLSGAPVQIRVGAADKLNIVEEGRVRLKGVDSYVLVPNNSATSVDIKIPQSLVEGIAAIESIRDSMINQLHGMEIAIFEATKYIDEVKDGVKSQILTELEGKYLADEDVDARILSMDLSNMKIVTDSNGTEISLRDIKDKYLELDNNYAGYTQDIQSAVTNSSSAVMATATLTASVDDIAIKVLSGEYASVGAYNEYVSGDPVPSNWRLNTGVYQVYIGDTIGWKDITNEAHQRYLTMFAIAGAKSLAVADNGTITGWEYTTGVDDILGSTFKIKADKFQLEAAGSTTTANVPFEVVAGSPNKIKFNGIVEFGNSIIDGSQGGTSTIDGGSISTGTIDASKINTNGLVADDIKGDTISGKYITASTIEGSVIKASFIDSSSSHYLTNWKYYTESTIPLVYIDNFAHNTDDTIVTTGPEKYVRLTGNNIIQFVGNKQSEAYSLKPYTIPLYSYDAYQVNTLMRAISASPTVTFFESAPGIISFINAYTSSQYASRADTVLADFSIYGDHFEVRLQSHYGGGYLLYNGTMKKNGVLIYNTGDVLCYGNETGCSAYNYTTSVTVSGVVIDIIINAPVNLVGFTSFYVRTRESYTSQYLTLVNYSGKSDPFFVLNSASVINANNNGMYAISTSVPYGKVIS